MKMHTQGPNQFIQSTKLNARPNCYMFSSVQIMAVLLGVEFMELVPTNTVQSCTFRIMFSDTQYCSEGDRG